MKSSKSMEFLAELKVLCKVHHINVVRNNVSMSLSIYRLYQTKV